MPYSPTCWSFAISRTPPGLRRRAHPLQSLPSRWAMIPAHRRISRLEADGYRAHSVSDSKSILSASSRASINSGLLRRPGRSSPEGLLRDNSADGHKAGHIACAIKVGRYRDMVSLVEMPAHWEVGRIEDYLVAFVVPCIDQYQAAGVQVKEGDVSVEYER